MTAGRYAVLTVRTPEGCSFPLRLAGPISRCLAFVLDVLCIMLLLMILNIAFNFMAFVSPSLAMFVMFLAQFVAFFGYGIFMEWFFGGRTLGKFLLSLRVMDEQGLRLTFPQVVIRNLLRIVDMMPGLYLVGGAACVLSRRAQRLGDLLAGTIVIRSAGPALTELPKGTQVRHNSLKAYPRLAARLRQEVSPAGAATACRALRRRDTLIPSARVKLFAGLADHFRDLVRFPIEATENLSDERYVRNVVDILYGDRERVPVKKKA